MSILIDGHIHIHPAVDLNRLLDAAWKNFTKNQQLLFPDSIHCSFVLLLAEGKENNVFSTLYKNTTVESKINPRGWNFVSTGETNSILAVQNEKQLLLIAGRQLISSEKLELLSLFCPKIFPDNKYSLNELAKLVTNAGGIPLLAWGVGKWLGQRGRIIQEFLKNPPVPVFFVGDNGNRPLFWRYPKLLVQAEEQGVPSLSGSDPLPIADHDLRAGSYGGGLDNVDLSTKHPADDLSQLLSSNGNIIPFGRGVGCIQFFRDQVQVNLQKRL